MSRRERFEILSAMNPPEATALAALDPEARDWTLAAKSPEERRQAQTAMKLADMRRLIEMKAVPARLPPSSASPTWEDVALFQALHPEEYTLADRKGQPVFVHCPSADVGSVGGFTGQSGFSVDRASLPPIVAEVGAIYARYERQVYAGNRGSTLLDDSSDAD
jgi:hypothetical protein